MRGDGVRWFGVFPTPGNIFWAALCDLWVRCINKSRMNADDDTAHSSFHGSQARNPSIEALDETHQAVLKALKLAGFSDFEDTITNLPALAIPDHKKYCLHKLEALPASFTALAASRPWLLFWAVRALSLMGHELPIASKRKCIHLLSLCQSESGGFGGGPGQLPHLAPSYAACATLSEL